MLVDPIMADVACNIREVEVLETGHWVVWDEHGRNLKCDLTWRDVTNLEERGADELERGDGLRLGDVRLRPLGLLPLLRP